MATDRDVENIIEVQHKYPYYNFPHLVLAGVYKTRNDYRFGEQLKKAALRVADREKLYHYLNNLTEVPNAENGATEKEVEEPVKTETTSTDLTQVVFSENAPDIQEQIVIENSDLQHKTTETKPEITVDWSEVEDVKEEDKEIIEPTAELEGLVFEPDVRDIERKSVSYNLLALYPEEEVVTEKLPDPSADFFVWLSKAENHATATDLVSKPTEKSVKSIALIEKFETLKPSISRPKAEFYNPENMAKRSEQMPDVVTETLAKIYRKQGNIKMAIDAYSKLRLLFPQKEAYFAALITELEQELNA